MQRETKPNQTKHYTYMKVKLNVDQRASLIAGLEAPDSTLMLDISVASLSPETRALILPHYNAASGEIRGLPDVLSDTDARQALAVIISYARALKK